VLISLQALTLSVTLLAAPQGAPGAPSGPPQPGAARQAQTEAPGIDWPVSLERIKEAIARPTAIKTTSGRPVFRVEVFGKEPTIEDILGPDYLVGPTSYGGMPHQEFLTMVTPAEYRGMGVFTVGEALTVAAMALGLQWALNKAIDTLKPIERLKEARTERAKEAARREVLAAMADLAAARAKAGLPPR
jgi:hypothetical protein